MNRPFFAGLVFTCVLVSNGCGSGTTSPLSSDLLPVELPQFDRLEDVVREQLRAGQARLDQALADGVESAELARLYGELGRLCHAYGLRQTAAPCYRNAHTLDPADFRWPYYLGQVYRTEGDADESVRHFLAVLESKPDHLPTRVALSGIYLEDGRTEDAESQLEAALRFDDGCAAALVALGRLALAVNDYERAVQHLGRALQLQPQASEIHYPLGIAHRELGDMEKAKAFLAQGGSVKVSLDDPLMRELGELQSGMRRHQNRGNEYYLAGDYAGARDEFMKAVEADPSSSLVRRNLGTALSMLGDDEGALEQYRAAFELDPDNAHVNFGLGRLLGKQGRHEDAAGYYQRALESNPGLSDAHFNLGNTLRWLDRFEEAAHHYSRVVEIDPRNGAARLRKALALIRLGRWADTFRELEESHVALPEDILLASAFARVLASCPEPGHRDGERALELAQRLVDANRSLDNVEAVAMALAEVGRFEDAARWQRMGVEAAEGARRDDVLPRLRENLASYEAERPCRAPWPVHDPILEPSQRR